MLLNACKTLLASAASTAASTIVSVKQLLGFFEVRCCNNNKNNKMSSDMGSVPDPSEDDDNEQ